MKTFRIVVLGSAGVGKSALTVRFVEGQFIKHYDPTIEDSYQKVIEMPNGKPLRLEILDTAGTDQFAAMRDVYMRTGDGFLLVYSICSLDTLNDLGALRKQLIKIRGREVPIVLVGNKSDMEGLRSVGRREAERIAAEWGVTFWETSALLGTNVEGAFKSCINIPTDANDRRCCCIQ